MSPENSSGKSAESQEWQGQKWEYLGVRTYGDSLEFFAIVKYSKGFWSLDTEASPIAEDYNKKLEEATTRETKTKIIIALCIAGNEGWELVTSVLHKDAVLSADFGNLLILKRPIILQE